MRKGSNSQHSSWLLRLELIPGKDSEILGFFAEAAKRLRADFACLTALTPEEVQTGQKNGTVTRIDKSGRQVNFFVATQDLAKWIPDLYWVTIFGPPYVKLLGRERLLAAPVHLARPIDEMTVSLQLTARLDDLYANPASVQDTKERVKKFLGNDAFFQESNLLERRLATFQWD